MTTRSYSGSAVATTLASPINAGDNTLTIVAATNWPTTNFIITIDTGASEEKILVGSRSGTTCNSLTRGFDDTADVSHLAGVAVRHTYSAVDAREANAHNNATADVHGVTGSLAAAIAAVLSAAVQLTGNQTVAGTKTFSNAPVFPAGSIPESAITSLIVDLAAKVGTGGAQTINGVKTFLSDPVFNDNAIPQAKISGLTTSPRGLVASTTNAAVSSGSNTGTYVSYQSVTATCVVGRRYRATFVCAGYSSAVTNDEGQIAIFLDGTAGRETGRLRCFAGGSTYQLGVFHFEWVATATSHALDVRLRLLTGTGFFTVVANATNTAVLSVSDIGV